MKKYIVIYRATESAMEVMSDATPEDMKKGMEPWMTWAAKCGDGLVDMGTPLGGGQKLNKSGSSSSVSGVIGYSILQAEDVEAAKSMLRGHPHLDFAEGCEIEVHESLPLPM